MIFLRNHGAICSCPSGHVGDPLTACRLDVYKYLQHSNIYTSNVINQHLTERYKKSTIPYLQRLLNKDFNEKRKQFRKIITSVLSPVDNNICYTAGKIYPINKINK